jgi:hypothetical protein
MTSGHEAFGLLHRGTFEKDTQLLVGLPPLRSRWFGLRPEEDCHGGNILARPGEERWIITVIVADAAVDVASSTSSRAAIVATLELLLECHAQLRQSLLLLLKLSLKLPKLI